jgi:hypothetical protein
LGNLSISISNALNLFGGSPSTKWGSGNMTWGASKWGEGTLNTPFVVIKQIDNALLPDATIATLLEVQIGIANALAFASDSTAEGLGDGSGWNYIFVRPTTDAEQRTGATYAEVSASPVSYTCATAANITWS